MKHLSSLLVALPGLASYVTCSVLLLGPTQPSAAAADTPATKAEEKDKTAAWPDPAPPTVAQAPTSASAAAPAPFDRLTFHSAPKPLNPQAKVSDWTHHLGPRLDVHSPETHLLHTFPPTGPKLLWEVVKGNSYSSPAVVGDRLILFHTLDHIETVDCLHPQTGQRYWTHAQPIDFQDRYGFGDGPRASPVIADGRVITLGVTSLLTCLDLISGAVLWQRDLRKEFNVPQDFFGQGSTPLVQDGRIIINVGGKAAPVPGEDDSEARFAALAQPGLSVGAFDLTTGKLLWGYKDEWGASYASPVPATIHGREVVLIYAGGESSPATGGLLCLDPKHGTLLNRFPWRGTAYIQSTGSSPVVIPGRDRALISTAYPKGKPHGGVMIQYAPDFTATPLWESKKFGTHWMTPLHLDGYLYGIDGETELKAQLVCFNEQTGAQQWRQDIMWDDTELNSGRIAKLGIQRASLLQVDGKTLCLGELGTLLWLNLSPEGCQVEARAQLFYAPHSWCLPALHHGLLYIMQNYEEQVRGQTGQRLLCYDLRGE